MSEIQRDHLHQPLDRAVYWIEYAIRHKGAPHLRTASRKLNFFQKDHVDVHLLIFLTIFLIFYIIIRKIIDTLYRMYCINKKIAKND